MNAEAGPERPPARSSFVEVLAKGASSLVPDAFSIASVLTFATLGAAVRYGTSVNACKLVLLVQSGTYPEDVRFDRQTDLLGRGATNPVVRGRLDGSDQAVSLNHVTVTGSRGDALVQRGGRLGAGRDASHGCQQHGEKRVS